MLPYLVLAAALTHNLHYTWRKWGDPVVDFGRELEVARLIAEGGSLYGSVRHYFGPLAPYVNGGLFALFGVGSGVLMTAGAVSAALMSWLLYLLAARLGGRLVGTATATLFLYLCAVGHYYWNGIFTWVAPYTYSATYGMLAATASLWLLVCHVHGDRSRDLHLSLVCLVLAGIGKLEPFAAAAAAHAVFLATTWRRVGTYVVAGAAGVGIFGLSWLTVGSRVVDDYLQFSLSGKFRPVLMTQMGLAEPMQALAASARSAGAFGAVIGALGIAGLLGRGGLTPWARGLTAASCAAGAAWMYWQLTIFDQLRALPILLAAILVWQASRWWRGAAARRLVLPDVLVVVFSLMCVARMPLSTGAYHYGFYLLPVPLLAFTTFLFRDLPLWLPGRPTWSVTWAAVGLSAALAFKHHETSRLLYDRHTVEVQARHGTMIFIDAVGAFPTGEAYAETVQLLASYPSTTRVLAVPAGVGLTFLAGLESVCGLHSFLPPELDGPFEERLLACLRAAPPDLVVQIGINLEDFGSRGFGADYAEKVSGWISEQYDPIGQFGPNGYVRVLQRHSG